MNIDKNLVKKYLNYKDENCDFDIVIEDVFAEMKSIATPKKNCILSDVSFENGFYKLDNLGIVLKSNDINKLFCECDKIATLVVTLGLEIDKKIAYYAKVDLAKSLIMDAASNVWVEAVMDELEAQVCKQMDGKFKTMRFSPGYGDLDISVQKSVIERTGSNKFLGINVNSNYLMTPLKSITAFLGFSDKKQVFADICLTCPQKGKCQTKCSRASHWFANLIYQMFV